MRQAVFLYSPDLWSRGFGPNHPLKPERLKRTFELLSAYEAFTASNVRLLEPRPASDQELALFHTPEYIEVVKALGDGETGLSYWRYGFGPGDNPIFEGMRESSGLKVGSALQAAELLLREECEVAFSFSGGLHHGGANFASGFCVFNDAAVAIHWLLTQGQRVAYIDIDVHHGDGVQDAFYDSDQVLTVSLHQDPRTLFPGTGYIHESGEGAGQGYSVNVPLPPGTSDEAYLKAFRALVPPLLARFAPDIVVTQLGVDTHFRDPLANLALTTHGQLAVFKELDRLASRWLALGGGGYAIEVVPRSWTLAFGVMAGLELGEELPQSYRDAYGGEWLHDREGPKLSERVQTRVAESVRSVVDQVKQTHHLTEDG